MNGIVWVEDNGGQAPTPRTRKKAKKKTEFVGWATRELIDFLESIGKETTKALSHYDVTNIVTQYVIDKKLINPDKKKRVVCDERLRALFGGRRQSILRNKIHDLLEPHLVENHVESDDDPNSSEDNEEDTFAVSKRQKTSISHKKTLPKKKVSEVSKSSLAAISPENIKLVYLKRSLVQQMLNDIETFESKVVGSFVRVKADRFDIFNKNEYQLQRVIGVQKVAAAGDGPPMLRLDGILDDISIPALSENDFTEEECEDLRRRFKEGLLKQPTVGELEQKVVNLHEDITKHWLARELVLLKNRLDQANEKGLRHKVMEYLDRRKLLQTPAEQTRLLNKIPEVLPEKVEPESIPDDPPDGDAFQNSDDSPKAADWEWDWHDSPAVGVTKVLSKQGGQVNVGTSSNGHTQPLSPEEGSPSEMEQVGTENNGHVEALEPTVTCHIREEAPEAESNGHRESRQLDQEDIPDTVVRAESTAHLLPSTKEGNAPLEDPKSKNVEIITLSDDEDEVELPSSTKPVLHDPECFDWHYLDPSCRVQGPVSLSSLYRWRNDGYFQPDFRVWKSGQSPQDAILLSSILQQVFPC